MHNHSIIWKNITMIIFLFILLIIVLFLNSKIKVEVFFNFSIPKEHKLEWDVNYTIGIIYFKKMKTFYKEDIDKWRKRRRERSSNPSSRNSIVKNYLSYFNKFISFFKFEKLIVRSGCGLISAIPTVYSVTALSLFLSYIFSHYKIIYSKNCNFTVKPSFNRLELYSKIHCILSTKIVNIIYIVFIIWSERRKKNGRTSNRRTYEYCYE